jgi:hypothetical protein
MKSAGLARLCGFYPGICFTTEEKAWKNLSQGSHTYLDLSTLSHKRHDFREKKDAIKYTVCASSFYTTFVCNIFNPKKN